MRKALLVFVVVLLTLVVLTGGGILYLRSGVTGPVPPQDPIVAANAEHADLAENAATHYRAAMDALVGQPPVDRRIQTCRELTELTPELRQWVANNEVVLPHLRKAAGCEACWFELQRHQNGMIAASHLGPLRLLSRYLAFRAQIAHEDHDLATFTEHLQLLNTLSGHMMQSPYVIEHLVGVATASLTQSLVTLPLTWDDLAADDRAKYIAAAIPCCDPLPPLGPVLAFERDLSVWMYTDIPQATGGSGLHLLAPPARLAGEVDEMTTQLSNFISLPIHEQLDARTPLRAAVEDRENAQEAGWNLARSLARTVLPAFMRSAVLRGQVMTQQRGNRTVLALFAARDRDGTFPESLDVLDAEFTIDPYSGEDFMYRRTDDGFTLYSVGADHEDDGGIHDDRFGEPRDEQPADGDYVFWPRAK